MKRLTDKIKSSFLEEYDRWPLWLPVIFGLGIITYLEFPIEPKLYISFILLELLVILAILFRYNKKILITILILGTYLFGFAYTNMRAIYVSAPKITSYYKNWNIEGRVDEVFQTPKRGQKAILSNLKIKGMEVVPKKIKLSLTMKSEKVREGDIISVRAKLYPPQQSMILLGYNFKRKAFFDEIGGYGYAISRLKILSHNNSLTIIDKLSHIRHSMTDKINQILDGDEGAIASALISGDRGKISKKLKNAYRDSGLAHFLSISGLHMSMVVAIVFGLVRLLLSFIPAISNRFDNKKIAAIFSIIISFLYLIISGFKIPTQRAFIMTSIAMLAIMFDKSVISIRVIMFAAISVLLITPEAITGPSFQMSFAAVIALIAAFEAFIGKTKTTLKQKTKSKTLSIILIYFIGIILSDLIASLATTPFAIYHFNRVAAYTLLGNFLAAPIIGLIIMPFGLFASLLMPFGLEKVPLNIMGEGIGLVNSITDYVSGLDGSAMQIPYMPAWGISIIAIGLLWLCLWQKKWRLWGILPILLGIISPVFNDYPDVIVTKKADVIALKVSENRDYIILPRSRGGRFDKSMLHTKLAFLTSNYEKQIIKHIYNGKKSLCKLKKADCNNFSLKCDDMSCIYKRNSQSVAITKFLKSLNRDCKEHDIVISSDYMKKEYCKSPKLVIHRRDLWSNNSYAIWLKEEGISYKTHPEQKIRLWD